MEKLKIKKGKVCVVVSQESSTVELRAQEDFYQAIHTICPVWEEDQGEDNERFVLRLSLFSAVRALEVWKNVSQKDREKLFDAQTQLQDSDGFAVLKIQKEIWILAHCERGIYYGVHDFIEKNFPITYARGAKEYALEYLPVERKGAEEIEISVFDYWEKSSFAIRVWNMCGVGTEGKEHSDLGSAAYYARNKINGIFHSVEKEWGEFGLRGCGVCAMPANRIDDLRLSHPQYFMTDVDGSPKASKHESFINYYDREVALVIAKRFVEFLREADDHLYEWIMPDNPYFYMKQQGIELSNQPFTTDDGVTVYPSDKNYKSTVYFNFLNRVVREINKLRPNTDILTFAYLYSEQAPATRIDEHLVVALAPIYTNEKYAYTDAQGVSNREIAENIKRWSHICQKLCIYPYWNSFKGDIYTRPILRQVQENLLWFENLGIYGVTVEGKLDCSLLEQMTPQQKSTRIFFDLNEACTWVINKLIWNPRENIDELLKRFAKIVYKETAGEFLEYYSLIEQGFNSMDAYVWYATGGDVYILQGIVQAGLAEEIKKVLAKGTEKSKTSSVAMRWQSIRQTVEKEIDKYSDFVKEEGVMLDATGEDILSERALDYKNNRDSVWNKATPMCVLRNYQTMEFYPAEAKFACRMLFDGESIFVGYSISDDMIKRTYYDQSGRLRVEREDGTLVESYAETYIGGNELNRSTYYGYISGFTPTNEGQFYQNDGTPVRIKKDCGLRDYYFVKTSENKEERYYFHVQKIPLAALDAVEENFKPYGSFVYYTDRFHRAGWMGFGLWSKQNFQPFVIKRKK